jgi:2-polyprenyl-3-methyl-5-hydroxy-6-metoxy-1,4-benzoquinol methylase
MEVTYKRYGYIFTKEDFISHLEQCPVCGAPKHRRDFFSYIDKNLDIYYLKCNHCLSISSSHYIKNEVLNDYYKQYYKLMRREDKKVTMHDWDGFAQHIVKYCSSLSEAKHIRILDYGGGDGRISYSIALELIKNKNIEHIDILVVDYEENIYAGEGKNITILNQKPNLKISGTFDLVLASAVLEHVFFVENLYKELFQCVQNNGYFYIRAPYMMPLYKALKMLNITIDAVYPEHVHDFSRDFFNNVLKIFEQQKFKIVVSQPSYFETTFNENFIKALFSRIIRFPYKIFKNYPFIGGWEAIYHKSNL